MIFSSCKGTVIDELEKEHSIFLYEVIKADCSFVGAFVGPMKCLKLLCAEFCWFSLLIPFRDC